jgi:hypothetical protein
VYTPPSFLYTLSHSLYTLSHALYTLSHLLLQTLLANKHSFRTATIVATRACKLYQLGKRAFDSICEWHPAFAKVHIVNERVYTLCTLSIRMASCIRQGTHCKYTLCTHTLCTLSLYTHTLCTLSLSTHPVHSLHIGDSQ